MHLGAVQRVEAKLAGVPFSNVHRLDKEVLQYIAQAAGELEVSV